MGKIKVQSAKAKGRRLQQWVCERISDLINLPFGPDCPVESRPMGQSGADVRLDREAQKLFPYAVECKSQEKWSVPQWIEQAKTHVKGDLNWLLFIKRNRSKPLVVMDADLFFKI